MLSKIPKAVPFILLSIFFERYSSGGIAATLSLFFHHKLGFDPSMSTALFHTYEASVFFLTIVGAIIADNWLGIYKTMLSFSVVYSIGAGLVAIGNIEPLNLPIKLFSLIGLLTAIVGVGIIKCNSNTFAANQYKVPEQTAQLNLYFTLQYFCMKSGSIIGRFFNPIMRKDVHCFGMNDCVPLAFGVPALAMLMSMLALFLGRKFYVHKALTENMFIRVCGCIVTAVKEKFKRHNIDSKEHWLDYAEEKYGLKLVGDTKMSLNALLMFVPVPVFWTLFMQQGSRWVFQATRMNGEIGFYTFKPDQMIIFNSVFSILLVPVFNYIFYPVFAKIGIKTQLQKMGCGFFFAALSFVFAALVEIKIEKEKIHIFWLLPQYCVMVMGEIMLYIPNLNFAYTEAPPNMKSVMVSCVYLTQACGNLFMVFISGTRLFESQVVEFLFFAGLMLIDLLIFIILAVKYKYVSKYEINDTK